MSRNLKGELLNTLFIIFVLIGDAEDRAAEQQRLEEEMRARYMQEYEASQREKNPFLNK